MAPPPFCHFKARPHRARPQGGAMQAVGGLAVAGGAPRLRWGGGHRRPGASRRCCCASAVASGVRSLRRDKMPGTGKVTFQEVFGVDLLANGTLTDQAILVGEGSVLVPLDIKRPMGMIVAERRVLNSMECFVEELLPESNALAAGVQPGDVLRMCTCVVEVRGKVDTFSFYSNPPKAAKRRAVLVCDKQPFSKVMKAIASNAEAVDLMDGTSRPFDSVCLVLERKQAA